MNFFFGIIKSNCGLWISVYPIAHTGKDYKLQTLTDAGIEEQSMAAEALFALTEFNRSQCPKNERKPLPLLPYSPSSSAL